MNYIKRYCIALIVISLCFMVPSCSNDEQSIKSEEKKNERPIGQLIEQTESITYKEVTYNDSTYRVLDSLYDCTQLKEFVHSESADTSLYAFMLLTIGGCRYPVDSAVLIIEDFASRNEEVLFAEAPLEYGIYSLESAAAICLVDDEFYSSEELEEELKGFIRAR